MTVSRDDIVAEARSWLGTRFRHRGCAKGVGVDCIGLVYGVARHFNLTDAVLPAYAPNPSNGSMLGGCEQYLLRIESPRFGSVGLFRFEREPTHVGIFGRHALHGLSLIHSYAAVRRAVEHGFDPTWRGRLIAAYDFPGVAD